jgi:AraC-like DNA-binding protein
LFIHFPPKELNLNDETLLSADGKAFAKLKIVSTAEKRTVFLTEHTLIFVIKGAKLLHFGEETVKAESGKIVLLKKGIYVMAEYIEKELHFEAILIFLSHKTIKDTVAASNISTIIKPPKNLPYLVLNSNEYLNDYINIFRKYFNTAQLKNFQFLQLKQKELLQLLICTIPSGNFLPFIRSLAKNEPESIEYIVNEYLLQPLSIVDYANLSNRSLASFKRDFRKIFNITPRQWINQKRLEQAYLLLLNTADRINEISYSCGFENPSYFIKLFKAHYGYTPQRLRTKSVTN